MQKLRSIKIPHNQSQTRAYCTNNKNHFLLFVCRNLAMRSILWSINRRKYYHFVTLSGIALVTFGYCFGFCCPFFGGNISSYHTDCVCGANMKKKINLIAVKNGLKRWTNQLAKWYYDEIFGLRLAVKWNSHWKLYYNNVAYVKRERKTIVENDLCAVSFVLAVDWRSRARSHRLTLSQRNMWM